MPVLAVRLIEVIILCSVVLLLLCSSLATPLALVAVLGGGSVAAVPRSLAVPVPVLLLPPSLLRVPLRSWRTPVETVAVLPVLLGVLRGFALAFVARKSCVAKISMPSCNRTPTRRGRPLRLRLGARTPD